MKLTAGDLRNVVQHLPKDVRYRLTKNKLFVGGGFIRAIVAGEKPSDIDMFGDTKQSLELASLYLQQDRQGSRLHTSGNAITLLTENRMPVQFITRWLFNSAEELVSSFDFTVCQAIVFFNKDTKNWDSIVHDNFYVDLAARRLVYTFPQREEEAGGSMLRVMKYVKRGYNIQIDSLAGVMARVQMAIIGHENFQVYNATEHNLSTLTKGLLREVDPLMVIDGLDVLDDHETDLEDQPISQFSDDIPF